MNGIDAEGNALRQWQGMVNLTLVQKMTITNRWQTQQTNCSWVVTLSQLCYPTGEWKGMQMAVWTFKQCFTEHKNHPLQANPFIYPEHKHLHPGKMIAVGETIRD